ncbi:MAG: hypothetical protein GY940_00500, partial [bacterium]|nr:hypothetical protein [bacterium]
SHTGNWFETTPGAVGELKEYLAHRLPEYMIPPYFTQLKSLPLTGGGKTDRGALPEPVVAVLAQANADPAGYVEKTLRTIWSDLLNIEGIGVNDNFFQSGGHSLTAVVMAGRVDKLFGVRLPLAELFKAPTIRGLAKYINNNEGNTFTLIKSAEKKEYYVLSPAQKRLYVIQQMQPESTLYNMPGVYPVAGGAETPDKEKISRVFRKLLHRHESLRTSFRMVNE